MRQEGKEKVELKCYNILSYVCQQLLRFIGWILGDIFKMKEFQ